MFKHFSIINLFGTSQHPKSTKQDLTTINHHIEESWMVLVVGFIQFRPGQCVFYLWFRVNSPVPQSLLMTFFVQGQHHHISGLKIGVLQGQDSLLTRTDKFYMYILLLVTYPFHMLLVHSSFCFIQRQFLVMFKN